MDNFPYLFAAYTAIWVGLFLYVRRLARRSRELEEEIQDLRRQLGRP